MKKKESNATQVVKHPRLTLEIPCEMALIQKRRWLGKNCKRAQNELSSKKIEWQCCFCSFVFVNFSIYWSAMDSQGIL
jgi:hypothetical protein